MRRGLSTVVAVLTFSHIFLFHPIQLNSVQSLIDFSFLIVHSERKQINQSQICECGERSGPLTQRFWFQTAEEVFKWLFTQKWKLCSSPLFCSNPVWLSLSCGTQKDIFNRISKLLFPYSDNCGHFHCMEKSCLSSQLNSCFCVSWKKLSPKACGQLFL